MTCQLASIYYQAPLTQHIYKSEPNNYDLTNDHCPPRTRETGLDLSWLSIQLLNLINVPLFTPPPPGPSETGDPRPLYSPSQPAHAGDGPAAHQDSDGRTVPRTRQLPPAQGEGKYDKIRVIQL